MLAPSNRCGIAWRLAAAFAKAAVALTPTCQPDSRWIWWAHNDEECGMNKKICVAGSVLAMVVSASAQAAGAFMDADWAEQMCQQWNQTSELTMGLAGKDWVENDAGRGYKSIHLYRTNCGDAAKVELELVSKDGKAICQYGGAVKHAELNYDVDYLMHADDEDWVCMGAGNWGCGAMGAMMTGKLKFDGPKGEAMGVIGPFDSFLLGTGKVAGVMKDCPK
jgi:putative sterol carrier protein